MNSTQKLQAQLNNRLPVFIVILFLLQPLLDALSFWLDAWGFGNGLTLALRFAMLAITALLGFTLSHRRKLYLILGGAWVVLIALHCWACVRAASAEPLLGPTTVATVLDDLANQLRICQLPLFALCFITFLQANERCADALLKGFVGSFMLIVALELIAVVTGTSAATYANKGLGICGWSTFPNALSAIISMLAPVVLACAYNSKDRRLLFPLTAAVIAAVLFAFGTRLAYLTVFATLLGFGVVLLIRRELTWRSALVLLAVAAICAACLHLSPMYINQQQHLQILAARQDDMDSLIEQGEEIYGEGDVRALEAAYSKYCPGLVERFGIERVAEKFDFSRDAAEVINVRAYKLTYCELLEEDLPTSSRLLGLELRNMGWQEYYYDVENDFHGIYYLCGAVGLAAYLAFLAYFIVLIASALLRDFRRYFTREAGAVGIALLLGLLNAYCTAGVLRRPNASFYLSALLAFSFYLVRIKTYAPKENPYVQ